MAARVEGPSRLFWKWLGGARIVLVHYGYVMSAISGAHFRVRRLLSEAMTVRNV